MVRKVILSMCLTMLATAALAQERVNERGEAVDPARDAREQGAQDARQQQVNVGVVGNDKVVLEQELAQSGNAGTVAAKIIAGQSGKDLPQAGVASFAADIAASRAQGATPENALLAAIQKRNPTMTLEDFADPNKGCGE